MTAASLGRTQIGPQATVVYIVRQVYREEQPNRIQKQIAASTTDLLCTAQYPPPALLGDELRDS